MPWLFGCRNETPNQTIIGMCLKEIGYSKKRRGSRTIDMCSVGEMSNEDTDMILSMVMDMMNDPKIDNGKLVRACLFGACIIAIAHNILKKDWVK